MVRRSRRMRGGGPGDPDEIVEPVNEAVTEAVDLEEPLEEPLKTFTAAYTAYLTAEGADKPTINETFADAIDAFIVTLQTELMKLRPETDGGRRHRRSRRSKRSRRPRKSRRSRRRH